MNKFEINVVDHISAMLSYWDNNLLCRFANSSYINWSGRTKEEILDKITFVEFFGPLYEMHRDKIERVLKGENSTFETEITFTDGKARHVIANFYADIINGEVIGFLVQITDVNDFKNLKSENEILSEQNRRLLNYSNIVSHNLKSYATNLESILGLVDGSESEIEKQELLNLLKLVSFNFNKTVGHLNDFVKSQNQAQIASELIKLHEYVEKCKDILQLQISSTNALIVNDISPQFSLMANPVYMESIFLNFLTNAIKYRRDGINPIITLTCIQENGRTALCIRDNGQGIDLIKHGQDLFGMYKTFHGNSDAEGIGLFITKYQVETMGGEIKVESTVGYGTIFTLYFT